MLQFYKLYKMLQQKGQKNSDSLTQNTEHSSSPQQLPQQQPYINRIIESTGQIINSQAIKIFELTNELKDKKKQHQTLHNKYQILLKTCQDEQPNKREDTPHQADQKKIIDSLVAKIGILENQLISAKMELAQSKASILQLKFQGMKSNKSLSSLSPHIPNIPELSKLKSAIQHISKLQKTEESLAISEWQKYIETYLEGYPRIRRFKEKTSDLIKKGIPNTLREHLWPLIFENSIGITPILYTELLSRKQKDENYTKRVVSQINKDICRSFNGKTQFDSKVGLNIEVIQILEIFHIYRPDVSYVQGMTYPAIVLNLIVGKYRGFTIFCNLILGNQFFRKLYMFQDNYLTCCCRAFDQLLQQKLPKVFSLLQEKGVHSEIYLVEWFYTFFSRGLSYEFTLKIWDYLAYQGELLFYKLALSIFQLLEDTLLEYEQSEPTAIIRQFSNYLTEAKLQQVLFGQKLTQEKLQKTLDKIFRSLKSQKSQ